MFPEDKEEPEFSPPEPCPHCGNNHEDLMQEFSEWLVDITSGHATLGQVLSIIRSLILNLRMNFSNAVIGALFAEEVVRVEHALLQTNYIVKNTETGEWQRLPTAEDHMEIDRLATTMPDMIPDWVLEQNNE